VSLRSRPIRLHSQLLESVGLQAEDANLNDASCDEQFAAGGLDTRGSGLRMDKVYFDNSAASRISNPGSADATELAAVQQLCAWGQAGIIDLGISRQTIREMEGAPPQNQANLKLGISGFDLAPDDHKILGIHTQHDRRGTIAVCPMVSDIVDEPLYAALRACGLNDGDAKQLLYVVTNGFAWFVTLDDDFLNCSSALETNCGSIRIRKPSELVAEISARGGLNSPEGLA